MNTNYQGYTIKFDERDEKFICDIGENGESSIISAEKISTIKNKIDKIGQAPKQKSQDAIELMGYGVDIRTRAVRVGTFGKMRYSKYGAWVSYKSGRSTEKRRYEGDYKLKDIRVVSDENKAEVDALIKELETQKNQFETIKDAYKVSMGNIEQKIKELSTPVQPTVSDDELPDWRN